MYQMPRIKKQQVIVATENQVTTPRAKHVISSLVLTRGKRNYARN